MGIFIHAEIKNLKYDKKVKSILDQIIVPSLKEVTINRTPGAFILTTQKENILFAINKWISPKRTRSYPYARVYDCLFQPVSKVIAIIPFVKDEGQGNNTDYLQWDTVALLSLLNVYVVIAYYEDAELKIRTSKSGSIKKSLTNQVLNEEWVKEKLLELSKYNASALHWNLNELQKNNLLNIINKAKGAYGLLAKRYQINLPSIKGLNNITRKLLSNVETFKDFSRRKSKSAQKREISIIQPKERLRYTKAAITITNYLGGEYNLTVDEFILDEKNCYLVEAKHSSKNLIPSINDIKDALIKMILYTNLENIEVNGIKCNNWIPVIRMTTSKIDGFYRNEEILKLRFPSKLRNFLKDLVFEAKTNNFEIWLEGIND